MHSDAKGVLAQIAHRFPHVARCLGLSRKDCRLDPIVHAEMQMCLGFGPKLRGAHSGRQAQAQAVTVLAHTGLRVQQQRVMQLLGGGGGGAPLAPGTHPCHGSVSRDSCVRPCGDGGGLVHVVKQLVWVWDEGDQKLSRFRCRSAGRTQHTGAVSAQLLVQGGMLGIYTRRTRDQAAMDVSLTKLLARPVRLQHATTNFVMEGIVRGSPFPFDDLPELMAGGLQRGEELLAWWFQLGSDRASQNFCIATIAFEVVLRCPKVIPTIQFCGAHGLVLARNRPKPAKSIHTGLSGFTKWMRLSTNLEAIERSVQEVVRERPFVWRREKRPETELAAAEEVKRALFHDQDVLWRTIKRKDGQVLYVQTKTHMCLDAVLACRQWCSRVDGYVHWCVQVEAPPTPTSFTDVASLRWCCANEGEARNKVETALLQWVSAKQWTVAADSRWTTQPISQRRFLVLELCDELMSRSLAQVRTQLGLHRDTVVETLKKLLEQDAQDFSAKNKLRLHSICTSLCASPHGSPTTTLAMLVTIGSFMDAVLYSLLGRAGVRERASLGVMLDPASSPILAAQYGLLDLLEHFDADATVWLLGALAHCPFDDVRCRHFARQQCLMYYCGLVQYFELPWSVDVYRASLVGLPGTPHVHRVRLAADFYDQSKRRCLSVAGKRIQELLPSAESFMQRADHAFAPLLAHTPLVNDYCERLNAKMRCEVFRASGQGSNMTLAANRHFCHSMKSAHIDRGGKDPATPSGARATQASLQARGVMRLPTTKTSRRSWWFSFHGVSQHASPCSYRPKSPPRADCPYPGTAFQRSSCD